MNHLTSIQGNAIPLFKFSKTFVPKVTIKFEELLVLEIH